MAGTGSSLSSSILNSLSAMNIGNASSSAGGTAVGGGLSGMLFQQHRSSAPAAVGERSTTSGQLNQSSSSVGNENALFLTIQVLETISSKIERIGARQEALERIVGEIDGKLQRSLQSDHALLITQFGEKLTNVTAPLHAQLLEKLAVSSTRLSQLDSDLRRIDDNQSKLDSRMARMETLLACSGGFGNGGGGNANNAAAYSIAANNSMATVHYQPSQQYVMPPVTIPQQQVMTGFTGGATQQQQNFPSHANNNQQQQQQLQQQNSSFFGSERIARENTVSNATTTSSKSTSSPVPPPQPPVMTATPAAHPASGKPATIATNVGGGGGGGFRLGSLMPVAANTNAINAPKTDNNKQTAFQPFAVAASTPKIQPNNPATTAATVSSNIFGSFAPAAGAGLKGLGQYLAPAFAAVAGSSTSPTSTTAAEKPPSSSPFSFVANSNNAAPNAGGILGGFKFGNSSPLAVKPQMPTASTSNAPANDEADDEGAGGAGGGGGGADQNPEAYAPNVDFQPIVRLDKLERVVTGEEDETPIFSERTKLFRFDRAKNEWKERGLGVIKLLKHKTLPQVRCVMRSEQVFKVRCNHIIKPNMKVLDVDAQPTQKLWHAMDYSENDQCEVESRMEMFRLRLKTAEQAQLFQDLFNKSARFADGDSHALDGVGAVADKESNSGGGGSTAAATDSTTANNAQKAANTTTNDAAVNGTTTRRGDQENSALENRRALEHVPLFKNL